MKKLLTKILSVIVAVTATLGLVMLPKTAVQASEFTFGAVAGASVKYGETIEETGLRFTIEVDKAFYATLGEGVEFGALLTTKKYASNNAVVIDPANGNIADVRYVTDATKFDADQPADSANHVYYASVTYKFDSAWQEEVKALFGDDADIEAYKLQALATELVCRPYYVVGKEVVYADLSDARSMVKVANGAVIDGDPITNDFIVKYLSSVVESDSEVYIEADGTIHGLTANDKAAIENATSLTVDGNAGDAAFPIEGNKVSTEYLADKVAGNYYYVTAFNGANGYRIKYMYVTKAIDEAEDLHYFTLTGATEDNPYNDRDGYFVVVKDIDASSLVLNDHVFMTGKTFPGNGYSADRGLVGTFDGLGHTIDGLAAKSNGLFGQMIHAKIRNVAFTNASLSGDYRTLFAHNINRGKTPDNNFSRIECKLENIYISIASIIGAGRTGVLANNQTYTGATISNVVVEYLNYEEHIQNYIANSGEVYLLGSMNKDNVSTAGASGTSEYKNVYTISKAPVLAHTYVPGIAINQIELIEENGKITGVGAIIDEDVKAYVDSLGLTPTLSNLMYGVKAYDDYSAMAVDGASNETSLATFNDKYWVVANGVPYWKSCYDGTVELAIEDKDGNVVSPSTIIFDDNATEYTVKLLDATHALSNLTITGEGLVQVGNKFKLENNPTDKGTIEVTVEASVNGVEIKRTFTISYTNEMVVEGKVLYSDDDNALDLRSLNVALMEAGEKTISLDDIDGYVVNGENLPVLDLEVIISNDTKKDYGRSRAVDTAQQVTIIVDGKAYVLSNVYAYTKLIDEAEDLNYFALKDPYEDDDPSNDESATYNEKDGYFLVTKNIDASNFDIQAHKFTQTKVYKDGVWTGAWTKDPVYPGNGYNADIGFRGVFDGQGYVIDGLTAKSCGIFANMNAAVVKNVAFTNVNLTGYYVSLFAKNFIRGKDYVNDFNGYEGLFQNVYISINSINYSASNGHIGILTQGTLPGPVVVENVIIDYLNVDKTTQSMIDKGNQFLMFGSSGLTMANDTARFKNSFSISTAPVSQLKSMPGFAENQVEFTLTDNKVTAVGAILDPQVTEVLTRAGKTLAVDHVCVGLRAYDDYTALAQDATANADKLATFGENWIVKNGVPYWKEVYKKNFALQVKQNGEVEEGEILVKDTKTEITLDILDIGGNPIEGVTVTAPEGVVVSGNVIKLASEPSSVGAYEVKVSAEVEGMLVEKWVTINYSNEYEVAGKVLYSQYDKALDLPSLNKALNEVGVDDVESVTYIVDGEEVEELDLEVIISGAIRTRNVDTAQTVSIKLGKKVVVLTNVYAYTRLIDELSDLDWISRPETKLDGFAGDAKDVEYTTDGTYAYSRYDGYYLMTKNISGAGLGDNGADYKLAGTQSSSSAKVGLTGVFDGNGYTISNFVLQSRGLFVFVNGGVVKNVAFKDCEISGYYPVVIAHAFTNYDVDGNGKKDIPLIKNVYVEGTKVNLDYTLSGREAGILSQNNFYTYAENVIVKHELNDAQKENITVKRFGILMTQYHHAAKIDTNGGMNAQYKDFYVISDAPLAFGWHATSTTWSHFLLAQNTVQVNADNKWELKDATKFALINDLLTRTYRMQVEVQKEKLDENGQPVLDDNGQPVMVKVKEYKDFAWETAADLVKAADVAMRIDVTSTMKQYINVEDMAAAGNNYANFDSAYWTIVDGVPTWNTLNA